MLACPALLVLVAAAAPSSSAPCKVAVLGVEATGGADDEGLTAALTEAVAAGARDASGCQVITPKDVRSMLSFAADRAACNADDASCIAELGAALGVQRVVATSVARLGHAWSASVRLIDIDHAQVLAGKERVVDGDAVMLRAAVQDLARGVFGAWTPLTTGLVVGGGVGAGVGLVAALASGGLFVWSSSTLADKDAGSVDKANALAAYTPSLVIAVAGAVVAVAGGGAAIAGLVLE